MAKNLLSDLPERPKDIVSIGDKVELRDRDGVEIKGFVERVARNHIWIRPHPRVIKGKIELHGIDWRDKKHWRFFAVSKLGDTRFKVYKKGIRKALFQEFGASDSFYGGFSWLPSYAKEMEYQKQRKERNEEKKKRNVASSVVEEYTEDEFNPMLEERVSNFDNLIYDLTFATNYLSPDEAWEDIKSHLRKEFPGLSEEDYKFYKSRWRVLRRRTARRGKNSTTAFC